MTHPILQHPKDKPFLGVALAFILVGAFILAYGLVAWLYNFLSAANLLNTPSSKVLGGLVVIGLGYVILELELVRKK